MVQNTDEIQEYQKAIEFLAENKENFAFDNKGIEHASIVLANMLKTTENEFLMFSGKLNTEVADQDIFVEELDKYLKSGKSFKLVLEENNEDDSEALKLVKEAAKINDHIQIKLANEQFLQKIRDFFDGEILHFAVSDERAYRLEIGKKAYKALCNFNDKKIAKKLKEFILMNFN